MHWSQKGRVCKLSFPNFALVEPSPKGPEGGRKHFSPVNMETSWGYGYCQWIKALKWVRHTQIQKLHRDLKTLFGMSQRIRTNQIRLESQGPIREKSVYHPKKELGSQLMMRPQDIQRPSTLSFTKKVINDTPATLSMYWSHLMSP